MNQGTTQSQPSVLGRDIELFLTGAGLLSPGVAFGAVPLTGGVASDIWRVRTRGRTFVVKKALGRLRVTQEWNVPVSRNASEVAWIIEAAKAAPKAVPCVLAHDAALGAFAMSYFDPADYPVWKEELLAGRVDASAAAEVGRIVAAIHSSTANSKDVAARFATDANFHSIRLEPYLEASARVHLDLADRLFALSRSVAGIRRVLVHGDVSPKNILIGAHGPVLLDAECAWFGEPAFDLAFCLNHLLLKCVQRPSSAGDLLAAFDALSASYLSDVRWEPASDVERRTARLLPALTLARIDGKSPVEYLTAEVDKALVRHISRALIASSSERLADIKSTWAKELHP